MGSCAAPSAKGDDKFITTDYLQQCRFTDPFEQAVSLLHDVIEDSDTTAEDLLNEGFPEFVVEVVVILSRRRGESYADFIERICLNPLARKIKLADIEDNLNVLRLASLGESDLRRVSKYHQAWKRLSTFEAGQ
ncbi:GTP pyrophosphokinase [Pseudomonas aeruginosa]|uniref:GTP pyrophosphokinase n=1 Tax=Pseudomonas aeruginosa TaxID=287 RepID=UPI0032426967